MFTDKVDDKKQDDNFHRGEKSEQMPPNETPSQIANNFVEQRSSGVAGIVESTLVFSKGLARFQENEGLLKEFLEALHKAKVLTAEEVKAGLNPKSGSAFSKMKKISEYASVIRDERILPLLSAGYSVLYELALLFQELERRQQGVDDLRERLLKSNGPVTRSWLKSQRTKLEKEVAALKSADPVPLPEAKLVALPEAQATALTSVDPSEAPSIQPTANAASDVRSEAARVENSTVEVGTAPIAAVLMTVNSKDVSALGKALNDKTSAKCLKVSELIDDRAVLLIQTKACTLLSMSAIIKSFGFDGCDRIGLIGNPKDHDIASTEVMAIYARGGMKGIPQKIEWKAEKEAVTLSNRVLAGIEGRRVHLFAKSPSDGWDSFIGEQNWRT